MQKQLKKHQKHITIPYSVLGLFLIGSFFPIFRSGGKGNLNFWQFVYNHTIFCDKPEYVPEEDYNSYFKKD